MPSPTIVLRRHDDRDFLIHLSGLTPEHRLADYRAGLFSHHQISLWATSAPRRFPSSTASSSGSLLVSPMSTELSPEIGPLRLAGDK
jgi:hypothetical protein